MVTKVGVWKDGRIVGTIEYAQNGTYRWKAWAYHAGGIDIKYLGRFPTELKAREAILKEHSIKTRKEDNNGLCRNLSEQAQATD